MSDQNPIHRDRGKSDDGPQPYTDEREIFAEDQACIEERASLMQNEGRPGIDEEERTSLQQEAAAERFEEIGEGENESRDDSRNRRE